MALATASVPRVPVAPGRLSTIIGCFHALLSHCATGRARTSLVEPAGKGTISRIGFLGKLVVLSSGPAAQVGPIKVAPAARSAARRVGCSVFIDDSSSAGRHVARRRENLASRQP